ncbi:MAG: AAA family ATPase, partial [Bacteroidota bacterium]
MIHKDDNTESLSTANFKVKNLKVFGSKENLYQNEKKYRKVYDESECRYLYCELSFYNKLFDETDWKANIRFVCRDINSGQQVCELNKPLLVRKEKNIIYVREGWGTPEPGWWRRGNYEWEVLVDEKPIGKSSFYIVEGGSVSEATNPYFNIREIKLFESGKDGLPVEDRIYMKKFAGHTTRYVNVEMYLENLRKEDTNFPLELQFNFYNDAGQHKAFMSYFKEIKDQREFILLDTGYGSDNIGYWYEDRYTLEVIFMDQLVAIVPFEVGSEDEELDGKQAFSTSKQTKEYITTETKKLTFDEARVELENLIGLNTVKEQINELATYLQFLKIRQDRGLEANQKFVLHSVFTGNPGTGKTTVANMLGKIYLSLGLLTHGKVMEVGRADLVGEFIGQTAPKTKKAIDKARGGILFIDEAYSLTNRGEDGKDFGREVIEVLLKEMSDGAGDIAIICAGYPKHMQHFLNSNPGLTSRLRNVVHFPDYSPDELMEIADFTAEKRNVVITKDARRFIKKKLIELYRSRDEQFGNARYVNGLIEEAKQNMALRLMNSTSNVDALDKSSLTEITRPDMEKVFNQGEDRNIHIPVDEALLEDTLAQLHELVGLEDVKQEVDELTKLVRYYQEIGKDVKKAFSLHTVFKGNPGTGKTTIARLLVQIYKALGILERGHLVECDRKSLVAGYIGQTAIKTNEMIEKSIGGGLFIDEAYGLTKGGENDFGK